MSMYSAPPFPQNWVIGIVDGDELEGKVEFSLGDGMIGEGPIGLSPGFLVFFLSVVGAGDGTGTMVMSGCALCV